MWKIFLYAPNTFFVHVPNLPLSPEFHLIVLLRHFFQHIYLLFPELLIFSDFFSGWIPIYLVLYLWTNEYCCNSHVICYLLVSIECICHSSSNLCTVISFEQVFFFSYSICLRLTVIHGIIYAESQSDSHL